MPRKGGTAGWDQGQGLGRGCSRAPVLPAHTGGFPWEASAVGLLETPGDLSTSPEPHASRIRAQVTVGSHGLRHPPSSGMGLGDDSEQRTVAVQGCNTTTDQFERP